MYITKSSSAAGRTRPWLGNTTTCPYYGFRQITKSSSAAECTRRRLNKPSTCPYYAFRYGQVLVLPSRRLVRPAADDDFVICRNAPHEQVLVLPS